MTSHNIPRAAGLSPRADRWIRRVSTVAVLVLAAAAAILSYAGLSRLADRAHIAHDLAWLLPVVVDGLTLVGGLQVLHSVLTGIRAWYGWLLTLLGVACSVSGNVAASPPDLLSRCVHAAPPIVLALSLEAVLRISRHRAVTDLPATAIPAAPASVLTAPAAFGTTAQTIPAQNDPAQNTTVHSTAQNSPAGESTGPGPESVAAPVPPLAPATAEAERVAAYAEQPTAHRNAPSSTPTDGLLAARPAASSAPAAAHWSATEQSPRPPAPHQVTHLRANETVHHRSEPQTTIMTGIDPVPVTDPETDTTPATAIEIIPISTQNTAADAATISPVPDSGAVPSPGVRVSTAAAEPVAVTGLDTAAEPFPDRPAREPLTSTASQATTSELIRAELAVDPHASAAAIARRIDRDPSTVRRHLRSLRAPGADSPASRPATDPERENLDAS